MDKMKTETSYIDQMNVEKIATLFPNRLTRGVVDGFVDYSGKVNVTEFLKIISPNNTVKVV